MFILIVIQDFKLNTTHTIEKVSKENILFINTYTFTIYFIVYTILYIKKIHNMKYIILY